MKWPTTPGLGPHLTCLLTTEQTWNRTTGPRTAQKHLLHLAILEAPTDPLVQMGRVGELTQTHPEDLVDLVGQDDLGGKIYPIRSPMTWKLFSWMPLGVMVWHPLEVGLLYHPREVGLLQRQVEACNQCCQEPPRRLAISSQIRATSRGSSSINRR